MDPNSDSGSVYQTLASVLAGGFQGYVDAQNQQPVYITAPAPQTAFGYQGVANNTGGVAGRFTLSPVMLLGLGVVAFLLLKR